MNKTNLFSNSTTRVKGFTLIELIIVIVIIAILAAIAIPAVSKYVSEASAKTCESNLATFRRIYEANKAYLEDKTPLEIFQESLKESDAKCPSGKAYKGINIAPKDFIAVCMVHAPRTETGNVYVFIGDVIKRIQENPNDFGLTDSWQIESNDQITNAINKKYDFGKLIVDDKAMIIEPYFNKNSKSMLVFAKQNYSGKNWNADYIYNPDDNKWYARGNKEVIMVANKDATDAYDEIIAKGWTAVTDPTEIRLVEK